MADKSNYADHATDNELVAAGSLAVEHRIFHHDYRAFTPHGGSNGEHLRGHLAENVLGNSEWRPKAYRRDPGYIFTREEVQSLNDGWTHHESDERRAELEAQMPTYRPQPHPLRGIRPGA